MFGALERQHGTARSRRTSFRNAAMFAPRSRRTSPWCDKDKDGAIDKAELQAAMQT
jgi:hypothetical protein